MLAQQIKDIAEGFGQEDVAEQFVSRLQEGSLTRDENDETHFCVYFLPFNPEINEIFIVDHKKAKKWLFPGGHIDKGGGLLDTLNREITEELGVASYFSTLENPFFLSVTHIEKNPIRPCRIHYDIWYLMKTDGGNFDVDPTEFYATKWVSISEARKLAVDPNTISALGMVEGL